MRLIAFCPETVEEKVCRRCIEGSECISLKCSIIFYSSLHFLSERCYALCERDDPDTIESECRTCDAEKHKKVSFFSRKNGGKAEKQEYEHVESMGKKKKSETASECDSENAFHTPESLVFHQEIKCESHWDDPCIDEGLRHHAFIGKRIPEKKCHCQESNVFRWWELHPRRYFMREKKRKNTCTHEDCYKCDLRSDIDTEQIDHSCKHVRTSWNRPHERAMRSSVEIKEKNGSLLPERISEGDEYE